LGAAAVAESISNSVYINHIQFHCTSVRPKMDTLQLPIWANRVNAALQYRER
jgi:hypothetical protein